VITVIVCLLLNFAYLHAALLVYFFFSLLLAITFYSLSFSFLIPHSHTLWSSYYVPLNNHHPLLPFSTPHTTTLSDTYTHLRLHTQIHTCTHTHTSPRLAVMTVLLCERLGHHTPSLIITSHTRHHSSQFIMHCLESSQGIRGHQRSSQVITLVVRRRRCDVVAVALTASVPEQPTAVVAAATLAVPAGAAVTVTLRTGLEP
jgi:hypothetical protein